LAAAVEAMVVVLQAMAMMTKTAVRAEVGVGTCVVAVQGKVLPAMVVQAVVGVVDRRVEVVVEVAGGKVVVEGKAVQAFPAREGLAVQAEVRRLVAVDHRVEAELAMVVSQAEVRVVNRAVEGEGDVVAALVAAQGREHWCLG